MAEPVPVGLVINPIAGMGGSVGLKGTDGEGVLREAIARGASPVAAIRAERALRVLRPAVGSLVRIRFIAGPGDLGESLLGRLGFHPRATGTGGDIAGSRRDTVAAAREMERIGARLILFAGGDGTARDIFAAIGDRVPVVGIPCGVKMYSGVFARSPEAAGHLAREFVERIDAGAAIRLSFLAEVMDIDEEAYRSGHLAARLHGYASCPRLADRLQGPKIRNSPGHDAAIRAAATEIAAGMVPDQINVVGPGRSAGAVLEALGLQGTLLGVDVVQDRRMIGRDVNADEVDRLAGTNPTRIILGVIGGQGYVLGRGNQQIGAALIRRVGRDNLVIISSEEKLARLAGGELYVDSGDPELDRELEGFVGVHTGVGRKMMMRLSAGQ